MPAHAVEDFKTKITIPVACDISVKRVTVTVSFPRGEAKHQYRQYDIDVIHAIDSVGAELQLAGRWN
jgi:hypothetical protein